MFQSDEETEEEILRQVDKAYIEMKENVDANTPQPDVSLGHILCFSSVLCIGFLFDNELVIWKRCTATCTCTCTCTPLHLRFIDL